MSEPLISVIIPAYNAEKTLGAAISSALTQTYPHLEIVVCDDGSTDATSAIATSYGDRVRLVRQDNAGVAAARNAAIAPSTGELCALLDADDILLPGHVSRCLRLWRDAGGGRRLVTANALYLTHDGIAPRRRLIPRPIPAREQRLRVMEHPFVTGFALFPRSMADELGGFDTTLRTAEDYDFWLRAVFHGWEVLFQMEPQALYRRGPGSLSTELTQMQGDGSAVLRKLSLDADVRLTEEERRDLDRRLAADPVLAYIERGERALLAGDRRAAATEFAAASRLWPSNAGLTRKALLLRVPFTGAALTRLQERRHRQT